MNNERHGIQRKLGMLKLAEKLGNVSEACKTFGYSRDSFYRIRNLYETGGTEALKEISRCKPNHKNRTCSETEQSVIDFALENPGYGQKRVSDELMKKGVLVPSSTVRTIWQRNDLETKDKRLKALEAKVAQEGILLTEEQKVLLEKRRNQKESYGEIETEHPGFLGCQDTFYVGFLKGVGKVYQQTFLDTYSRVGFAKLYTHKTALAAAEILDDKVLPFFEVEEVKLQRILTDNGREYCGREENHPYQLYLSLEEIEHTKTKVARPQTNGIAERFHRTILTEFYEKAFRTKLYEELDGLQKDVDEWLEYYNSERPHQGRYCYGKTPLQTFKEAKKLAQEKYIEPDQEILSKVV
ncbi:MAG: IS481 family transposase [bacterium]|jgi:transposase InsO family protein